MYVLWDELVLFQHNKGDMRHTSVNSNVFRTPKYFNVSILFYPHPVLPNTTIYSVFPYPLISSFSHQDWLRSLGLGLFLLACSWALQEGSPIAARTQAWLVPGVPVGASCEMRQAHSLVGILITKPSLFIGSLLKNKIVSRCEKQNEEAESRETCSELCIS